MCSFEDITIFVPHNTGAVFNLSLIDSLKKCMRNLVLEIQYNEEKQGIFYWLGTHERTSKYINPAVQGHVICTSSSLVKTGQAIHDVEHFVDEEAAYIHTKDEPNSWFAVNLEPCSMLIRPTRYSISTLRDQGWAYVRNWQLEASFDGKNWVVIRKHERDASFTLGNQVHDFALECDRYFKHFRIFNYGITDGTTNHLCVTKFELYGSVQLPPNHLAMLKNISAKVQPK
jgi:hypothetical protein